MKHQIASIWFSILLSLVNLYADVEGVDIYEGYYTQEGILPPIITASGNNSESKLSFIPAPVNENGVSINKFNKLDLTSYSEVDIDLPQGSSDGDMYAIVLEQVTTESIVYLKGSIKNKNNSKIPLALDSRSLVDINSCDFNNFSEIYFESNNSQTATCTEGFTIKDIKADNCPIIFVGEKYLLDGQLELDSNLMTVNSDCDCDFGLNAKTFNLSGIDATCGQAFKNQGNLNIQGPLIVKASGFSNEGSWQYMPWTQEMINDRQAFTTRTMVLDEFNVFGWLDNIWERQYQRQLEDKGIIQSLGAQIEIKEGGFNITKGGKVFIKENPSLNSFIVADGRILLDAMRVDTQDGLYREGFQYFPSELNITGNSIIYSKNSDVLNQGSIFRSSGQLHMQAGQDITNTNLAGSFESHVTSKPHVRIGEHKRKHMSYTDYLAKHNCFPFYRGCHNLRTGIPERLTHDEVSYKWGFEELEEVRVPWEDLLANNLFVQKWPGNEIFHHTTTVNQVAFTDISGNITYVAAGNFTELGSLSIYGEGSRVLIKTGDKYILKGSIDGINSQKTALPAIGDGSESNSLSFVSSLLADKSGKIKIGGLAYAGGRVKIEAKGGVDVDKALFLAKDDVEIEAPEVSIDAFIEMHKREWKKGKTKYTSWDSVYNPAGIYSAKKLNVTTNKININGGFLSSKDNSTITTETLNLTDISETRQNVAVTKKRNILGSSSLTQSNSVTAHAQAELLSEQGYVNINSKAINMEGGSIKGGSGEVIETKNLIANPHIVEHVHRIEVKRSGLRLPGVGNNVIDAINGEFSVGNVYKSMPLVQALSQAFKTASPTDLAPATRALGEIYQAGEVFSNSYTQSGTTSTALADLFMNQAGLTTINGFLVPSSIGFGTEVYSKEFQTQIAYPSQLSGENLHVTTENGDLKAIEIDSKRLILNVYNELKIGNVALKSSEKSSSKGHLIGISFDKNSITAFSKHNKGKSYFEANRQQISKIFAGESAVINVQGNADIIAKITSPGLKLHVTNHLNLETKQDTSTGKSSQSQVNAGITYLPGMNSLIPSGGYFGNRGVYVKNYSNELTSIEADVVDIVANSMSLIGSLIKAKSGTIDVNTMTFKDLLDTDQATIHSFGLDFSSLKTLISTMASGNENLPISGTPYGSALKGMIETGYSEKDIQEMVHATISQGIVIKTNSDISDLNRDTDKIRERIKDKNFKLSVAVPVVDIQQFGENLKKMGVAAQSISEKLSKRLQWARSSIPESTQTQDIWEGLQTTEELVKDVEALDIDEKEKLALLGRLDVILSHPKQSTQYLVQVKASKEDAAESTVIDTLELKEDQATFISGDSIMLVVDEDFNKETVQAFESVGLGDKARKLVDKVYVLTEFLLYFTLYNPSEFEKGLAMTPLKTVCESCVGYAKLADVALDAQEVTKDIKKFDSLDLSQKAEILATIGLELGQQVLEGLKETFTSARGWGEFTGDLAMGGVGALLKAPLKCPVKQAILTPNKACNIANPLPKNMEFARVLKRDQLELLKNDNKVFLSSFTDAKEAFITTSESIPQGLSRQEYANLLAIPEKNIGGILRFKIKPSDDVALATPYNRFEFSEFINGGKTAGGLPEFVIKNQDIRNFEFWIEEIK